MKKEQLFLAAMAVAGLSLGPAVQVQAAADQGEDAVLEVKAQESKDEHIKTGKIRLIFDSDLGIGNDGKQVSVTADGSNTDRYYIQNTEVVNNNGEFTSANPPELEITLVSSDEDKWYFPTSSSDGFRFELSEASKNRYEKVKFVSAKRQDHNTLLTLRVQLLFDKEANTRPAVAVAGTSSNTSSEEFGWDKGEFGKARWKKLDSARYYQVQLIKDGVVSGIVRSVYQDYYDFSRYITEPGQYQFQVRSVSNENHRKSEWTISENLTVNGDGSF